MHARRKGKSGSNKPLRTSPPEWVVLQPAEIEEEVIKLWKDGHSTSIIGIKLRDQLGIPSVKLTTGKNIARILKDAGVAPNLPEDLSNLMKRALNLQAHLSEHPKDLHNKRALHLVEAKIRRLTRYYVRESVLPPDWRYSIATAKLLVE